MSEAEFLPYGRQIIDQADQRSVVDALESQWLTTGPKVAEFEKAWARLCGSEEAVAVCSGTAALHTAVSVLDLNPSDYVIVTPITFVASVNCVLYTSAVPLFADVDPATLLISSEHVARLVRKYRNVKAIITVDYAGQPCDYDAIRIAAPGIPIIADACHSPGATYKGRKVGTLGNLNCFSFHPVKHLTTGEGGAITTDQSSFVHRMRQFRNHGIETDHRMRAAAGTWRYEMTELGFNYRITDIQCALGLSQLDKFPLWLQRRRDLARLYEEHLSTLEGIEPLSVSPDVEHAWHLYIVRVNPAFGLSRDEVFAKLREVGIGANVHYYPVHCHQYYRKNFGFGPGMCPVAETAAEEILTLPLWAGMEPSDVVRVVSALRSMQEGIF